MPRFKALMIEDSETFGTPIAAIVSHAGFDLTWVRTLADYRTWLKTRDPDQPLDLVILDRQLPVSDKAPDPMFEAGESIFAELLSQFIDTPIVHLTGHADLDHSASSVRDRPRITVGPDSSEIDSVYYFRKSEVLSFQECIQRIGMALAAIDNIELDCSSSPSSTEVRILKRTGLECGAFSVKAERLSGGMSGASVWKCSLTAEATAPNNVVVKIAQGGSSFSTLQLSTDSSSNIVAPLLRVRGLTSGYEAAVYQVAGDSDLFSVLRRDPGTAAAVARSALDTLSNVATPKGVTLETLISPFAKWDYLQAVCQDLGLPTPLRNKWVSIKSANQHGDLHPANIMITNTGQSRIIDLDSEGRMSSIVDCFTLFWSVLFHRDSDYRDLAWPTPDEVKSMHAPASNTQLHDWKTVASAIDPWFGELWDFMKDGIQSPNEYWGLLMGYSARQLKYPDVRSLPTTFSRAVDLLTLSVMRINES